MSGIRPRRFDENPFLTSLFSRDRARAAERAPILLMPELPNGEVVWGDRAWRLGEIGGRISGEHGPTHGFPEAGREGRSRR